MRSYPKEVKDFIAENVQGQATKKLVELVNEKFSLGLTESQIRSYKKNHHLTSGTPCGKPKGSGSSVFPKDVTDYIYQNHKGLSHKAIADSINARFGTSYTVKQITTYYKNHKISSGLTGHFIKGCAPPNKGKKGHYVPGCEKGWF